MKISAKFACGMLAFATLTRIAMPPLLGHPVNFSPIDAIALFSGAVFSKRSTAIMITLFLVWIGDVLINSFNAGQVVIFYPGFYWQYACYVLMVLLGSTLQGRIKPLPVALACLGSATLFFIVSNFGVWYSGMLYPLTMQGLIECYVAAIPFFQNTLVSDLFFSAVLFVQRGQKTSPIRFSLS